MINISSQMFHSQESAIEFLLSENFIIDSITCVCNSPAKLVDCSGTFKFRCTKKGCQKRISLLGDTVYDGSKFKIHILLLLLFFFCYDLRNFQFTGFIGCADSSITLFKKRQEL